MVYICPKTGQPYEPSATQSSDDPDLIWVRCTRCTAKGQTAAELGVRAITSGGQWHGAPRASLVRLMDIAGQFAAFRQLAAPALRERVAR